MACEKVHFVSLKGTFNKHRSNLIGPHYIGYILKKNFKCNFFVTRGLYLFSVTVAMLGEKDDDKPICAICREDTDCDFLTRCGHQFHEDCLSRISDPTICPYCKQYISRLKWREKILFKAKNMDIDIKNDIYAILNSITGVDVLTGVSGRWPPIMPFGKCSLEELTKVGWDINSPNEGGAKLLEWVCQRDDLYRLNLLFEFGLKLDENLELKNMALNAAKGNNSNLVISRINDYSSNLSSDDKGNSPLHIAATKNDLESVKSLIARGFDTNARNIYFVRPLHIAASEANMDILCHLLENGAKVDCHDLNGRNPLHEACRSTKANSAEVVKKLIKAGANIDYLDNDKNTLLHSALIGKKFDIAESLIGSYSDINLLNVYKESFIHLASSHGPKSLLEKIVAAGADVNVKDLMGQTPLHKAVLTNNVEVVEFLLQKGADVNALNNKKEYPILLALKRIPSMPYVKALVRHGADLSVKDQNGLSIVELALESRY